jgi:hypothetical protein
MQFRGLFKYGWLGALTLVGLLGVASAQEEGTPPAPSADGSVDMNRNVQLSPEEMVKESDGILLDAEAAARNIQKMLGKAREDRDVVKSLCLDDKLSQLHVTQQSAGERAKSLRLAAARQDQGLASHDFSILLVFKERVAQLAAEANQCVGVEAGFVGDSTITVDIDPNLPTDDPSEYPTNPIISVPPGCVSCVQ